MTEAGDVRPEHDPLAEDLDLMTTKEAAARLYDALVIAREQVVELERAGAGAEQLAEAKARARDLEDAIGRAGKGATPAF
jgi:hypothetical protein